MYYFSKIKFILLLQTIVYRNSDKLNFGKDLCLPVHATYSPSAIPVEDNSILTPF
jgi:hypothetical protein